MIAANRQFCELFKVSNKVMGNEFFFGLYKGRWNVPELQGMLKDVLAENREYRKYEVTRWFPGVGEKKLLAALPGLRRMRDPLALEARDRPLRAWLFSADAPAIACEDEGGIQVERGVEWTNQIAEELGKPVELPAGAKVYDFEAARKAQGQGVTPLPLDQMMKKSRENKRKNSLKQPE